MASLERGEPPLSNNTGDRSDHRKRNRRDGRFIERVGFYNPIAAQGEEALRLSVDRISFWQQRGARLSDTVAGLVKRSSKSAATAASAAAASPVEPAA